MGIISFIEGLSKNFSFIRWVKGNADIREAEKWDAWVNESPTNLKLAKEAQKKVLGIDFTNSCSNQYDVVKEWNQLLSRIKPNKEEKDFSTKTAISGQRKLLLFAKLLWVSAVTGITFFGINFSLHGGQTQEDIYKWSLRETRLLHNTPAPLLTYLPTKLKEREQHSKVAISSNGNVHVAKMVKISSGKSRLKKNISYPDTDFNITKNYLPTAFKKSESQRDFLKKKLFTTVF